MATGEMMRSGGRRLDDSPDFKEALQVVDLTQGHGHQNQRLEKRPQHHPGVGVVVD